jgi:hypothetical protein
MAIMKHLMIACAAALLCLAGAASARSADNSGGRVFALRAENGSGQSGTVALKPRGATTIVEIHLLNAPASAEPAHIHVGPCSHLNPAPKYPLTPVVNGISETTVKEPIAVLTAGNLAVNVHKSAADLTAYVACGNLSSAASM